MNNHDHKQMLGLFEQWQASGESKSAFAVSHGLRPSAFYYWASKFEHALTTDVQASPRASSGFQRISIERASHKNQGELMAAIQYPSGIRLELYSSFQDLGSSYVRLLKTLTE